MPTLLAITPRGGPTSRQTTTITITGSGIQDGKGDQSLPNRGLTCKFSNLLSASVVDGTFQDANGGQVNIYRAARITAPMA